VTCFLFLHRLQLVVPTSRLSLQCCDSHVKFDIVLPWQNPRWVMAFVAVLLVYAAIVFGVVHFAQVRVFTAVACAVILTDAGILVWFQQSPFRRRKALRDALLFLLSGSIIVAGSLILYERSKAGIAILFILIVLLSRSVWGRALFKKLQAENEKEASH